MTLTRARTIQYFGILLSLGLIAVGYWYFSARAGVKTNTSASQSQGTGRLDSGLAGYWKLDDGTSGATPTTATDSSTNGSTGTLTGGPTWTTGQVISAVDFDGTDDYITVADTDTLDFADSTNFSLSGWFNRDTFTTDDTILAKSNGQAASDTGYNVYIDDTTDKVTFVANDGTDQYKLESTGTFTATGWHHFTVVWDESGAAQTKLYIDGTNANATATGTFANVNSIANAVAFRIGAESDAGNPFDGKLDEVRVYGRKLSDDEVQRLYRLTAPTSVDTSLKGYWSFDGQDISGTKAYDLSGAGNTGTLTGGLAATRGIVGQAFDFNGVNNYINIGDVSTIESQTQLTASAWVNADNVTGEHHFFDKSNCSGVSGVFEFLVYNGIAKFIIHSPTTAYGTVESAPATISTGQWYHLTGVYDGSYVRLYINGVEIQEVKTTAASITFGSDATPLQIGGDCNAHGGLYWDGRIDEARVYTRALSAAEIKAQYDAAKPDKANSSSSQPQGMGRLDSGLLGYWPFDNGSGTTASDLSTNGINGTLTNGPTWTNGQINGAISFDGTNDGVNLGDVNLLDGTSRMTISSWIRTTSLVGAGPTAGDSILSKYTGASAQFDFHLNFNNDTVCTADNSVGITFASTGQGAACTAADTHSINVWEHWVLVYDGSQTGDSNRLKIYKNGVLQTLTFPSAIPAALQSNSDPLYIGTDTGNWAFNGIIDEVRIYDRPLSADEVGQLYRLATPTAVDTSLKGYWSFNGQDISGTTAYDRSGAGNTGTLTAGPVVKRGTTGQSLDFDGTDDYVSVADSSSLDSNNTDFTLTGWFRRDTFTTDDTVIAKRNGIANTDDGYLCYIDDVTDHFTCEMSENTGTDEFQLEAPTPFTSVGWHAFALVWSDASATGTDIYIDGVPTNATKTGTIGNMGDLSNALVLAIGAESDAGNPFDGSIDEVRVYTRALSADEIKSMYDTAAPDKVNTSVSTPQGTGQLNSDLVGYWKLDENTGTSAADSSTNGNTGTLTGGPTWTTGRIGSAVNFDGTNDQITTTTSYVNPQEYTVSAWFNTTVASGTNIVGFANLQTAANATQSDRQLYIGLDGKIYHGWFSGVLNQVGTSTTYNDGAWHHAVGTHTGVGAGIGALYVDGVLVGTGSGSAESTTGWWRIAQPENSGWTGVDGYFNGKIDEVRVYNRALSADEVSQLYRLTTPTAVDTSLKGYWSFNGQDMSGTTAYDRSGAQNSATLINGVAVGRGKIGQAVTLDGVNDYIATDADFNQLNGATALTASIWVKTTAMSSERHFFQKSGCQGLGNGGIFELGGGFVSAGKPEFTIYKAGGSPAYYQIGSSASIADGVWHMVTGTYDGANLRIYVDAVDTGSTPAASVTLPSITGTIEFGECLGINFLAGSLDEARVYNRALSAAEIQALYNSGR